MSRWMNQMAGGTPGNGQSTSTWLPPLDVLETEDELVLSFDLPGVPEDTISVELDNSVLTVSGERERRSEESGERFHRYERRFGAFSRSVTLPQGVNEDSIKADYDAGVLEIRVPKPQEPKPKRIPLSGSEQKTIEGSVMRS